MSSEQLAAEFAGKLSDALASAYRRAGGIAHIAKRANGAMMIRNIAVLEAAAVHEALTAPTRDGEVGRLRALLQPFAEAAESLDDGHRDNGDIWESSAAIGITAGNLRAARAALTTQAEG